MFVLIFSVTRRSRSDESHSLTDWVDVLIDFTDVTLVSEDTYRRLYWWDPDDSDDHDDHDNRDDDHDEYILKVHFPKVYFQKCIFWKCIFWICIFRKCIFRKVFFCQSLN